MSNLYEILRGLCQEKGISGARMCEDIGYSKSLMTELKSGRKKSVSADVAIKLANYFEVSVDYLMGQPEQNKNAPTSEDDVKVALFGGSENVSDEDWKQVMDFVEFIKSKKGKNDRN